MKKVVVSIGVVVLVIIGAVFLLKNYTNPTPTAFPVPTTVPSTTSVASNFCKSADLEASLTTQGTAGNIYGTLTLKNISGKTCDVLGSNFVSPNFNAANLKVMDQGQMGEATITLSPNQIVYSQIHYPNGPQCSGPVKQADISYSYKISPSALVVFSGPNGKTELSVGVCTSATELTTIDVWSLSSKPVNQ